MAGPLYVMFVSIGLLVLLNSAQPHVLGQAMRHTGSEHGWPSRKMALVHKSCWISLVGSAGALADRIGGGKLAAGYMRSSPQAGIFTLLKTKSQLTFVPSGILPLAQPHSSLNLYDGAD